jgi:hypothetical protein
LIWRGRGDVASAVEGMPDALSGADYKYAARPAFNAEPGRVTPFGAVRADRKDDLLGMWIETKDGGDKYALLVWGRFRPNKPAAAATAPANDSGEPAAAAEPEVLPAAPTAVNKPAALRPVAAAAAVGNAKVPAELLGAWSWTTISGVNYRDTITKQLAEPSGMSAKFTFRKDGGYHFFFYVRQRTYSLVTESNTTAEGTVTFGSDGTFTVRPVRGHYKGHTGGRVIDRPMTAEERKPAVYHWEWRTEDGERRLYIGPSKASMSLFKRAED